LHSHFVPIDRQLASLLIQGIRSEFRGDEALDSGFGGGFDEEELLGEGGGAKCGDEGVVAA